MVRTGAHAYLKYGWEDSTFGGSSTVDKKFGVNDRFTSLTLSNNRMNLPQLNQNTLHSFAYGQQQGSANVSFTLSNPWVFGAVLGAPTTAGSSTYTHTYETNPSAGGFNLPKTVRTIQIESGIDGASTDVVRTFKGCILNTLNISSSVGGTVDATADITYGVESAPSTTLGSAPTEPTLEFPYTFAHAELYIGGNVVAQCQDANINITQNAELLYGLNSNQAVDAYKRVLDITGSFSYAWKDKTLLEKVLEQIKQGSSSGTYSETIGGSPEFQLTFQKSSTDKIVITGSGLSISDYGITGYEAVNPLFEDISWQMKTVKVVATNNQSAEE
jgi:hypothetical protein